MADAHWDDLRGLEMLLQRPNLYGKKCQFEAYVPSAHVTKCKAAATCDVTPTILPDVTSASPIRVSCLERFLLEKIFKILHIENEVNWLAVWVVLLFTWLQGTWMEEKNWIVLFLFLDRWSPLNWTLWNKVNALCMNMVIVVCHWITCN